MQSAIGIEIGVDGNKLLLQRDCSYKVEKEGFTGTILPDNDPE